jgi:deoxyhypusine synthase
MNIKSSLFEHEQDILPTRMTGGMGISDLIDLMGRLSFEARHVNRGADLFRQMIEDGDTIWLGIAGAGIAGGMGGIIISLLEKGFIDVICTTGAQVYHDLHFAFGLPVKAINPRVDDDLLRAHGDTRIYDIGIREKETLVAQDKIIREFVREEASRLSTSELASWEFNYRLGLWTAKKAKYPERSFVSTAARYGVPVFWDSLSNHSIAMNLVRCQKEGHKVSLSAQKDIIDSAAIVFSSTQTGFVELGGGGPKNFIQQTGPTISQILDIDFDGADRGLQISTAVEREGSLSSCTFGEAVTWGKYRSADDQNLVQIWCEYSIVFPLLSGFVLDKCKKRPHRTIVSKVPEYAEKLDKAV